MTHALSACSIAAAILLAAACAPATRSDRALDAGEGPVTARDQADDFHVQMPVDGVRDVMHAKLAHAQGVIEGVVLEDFTQIRINAAALRSLSREAGWRVHTTLAYGVQSDEFRNIVSKMVDHAAAKDIEAVTLDYMQMTQSCVRCHSYMRSEGLFRDVPGEVSQARPQRDPIVSLKEVMEAP